MIFKFWELVETVEVGLLQADSKGNAVKIINKTHPEGVNYTQIPHRSFGVCYTIDFDKSVKTLGVFYAKLT